MPGMFAGSNGGTVKLGESGGKFTETARQGVTFQNLGTDREHHALDAWLIGLVGNCRQRLFNRNTGLDQGSQLARNQGKVGRGEAPPETEAGTLLFLPGRGHFQWRPAAVAQLLAHHARAVGFQNPLLLFAAFVQRLEFKCGH